MNNKLLSFLGLAKRAGQLSIGFDSVSDTIKSGKAELVLFSSDISNNSEEKVRRLTDIYNIKTIKINASMNEIGNSIKKISGTIAVKDKNFAKNIIVLSADDNKEDLTL